MYLYGAMILNFLVDLLLILAANRLAGCPPSAVRCLMGAMLGGLYSGACMLPGWTVLGSLLCRGAVLVGIGLIAFGISCYVLRRCALLIFLSFALEGVVMGSGGGGAASLLTGTAAVLVLCFLGFRGGAASQELVEVELAKGEKSTALLALRDTGNTLRDPVTGQSVLVADHRSAAALLGLTRQQLLSPVETVASGVVPGLRLIPYRAVGCAGGMLVAIRLDQVRIGKWRGSTLVAFTPDGLGGNGAYRALTGGMV